jgi:glutaredoxin
MARIDVAHPPSGAKIELYIKDDCPYCARAMAHYDAAGIAYAAYDAQNDGTRKAEMLRFAHGDPTVPAIVIDGTYVQSGWGSPPRG